MLLLTASVELVLGAPLLLALLVVSTVLLALVVLGPLILGALLDPVPVLGGDAGK